MSGTTYCECPCSILDTETDAVCRICGRPVDFTARCEYFLLCNNAADGYAPMGILDPVPCCRRCADKLGITLYDDWMEAAHA